MCSTEARDRWSGASYPSRFSQPILCSSVQQHCPRRCVFFLRSQASRLRIPTDPPPYSIFSPVQQFRGALNVAALGAFLTYVGAGLDGQAGLGDFNLQLNDDYRGEVVRGCPAYDEVRRPSMDGFDLEKYQGKWYEQKFHDWTQFKVSAFASWLITVFPSNTNASPEGGLRHHPGYKADVGQEGKVAIKLRLMIPFSDFLMYSPLASE